jgi:phosphoserine phosphatase RsbU/P
LKPMHNLTLKSKFVIVISVVFLISALITLIVFFNVITRITNSLALRVATKQALLDKNKILAIIDREVVLSQKMADDAVLTGWARDGNNPLLQQKAIRQLESYRRLFRDNSYFIAMNSNLHYYTANRSTPPGSPLLAILSQENPADSWYFKSLRELRSFALNLNYDAHVHQTKVWINTVMRDDQGRKIGICGSGIDLTEFLDRIVQTDEEGVSTILIDRRGVIQAHADRTLVERNALELDPGKKTTLFSLLKNPADTVHLKQALENLSANKSTVVAFPLKTGQNQLLAAVTFMREIGWFNVVLVDVSHTQNFSLFLPIILVSLLALLGVIVAIAFQMNRMVLAPLSLLTSASHGISQGNYDISLPVRPGDEIGKLTDSFNMMTATILGHVDNLEENVRQRTTELSSANVKLEESQARIMESLNYASVIQASILPSSECFDRLFAEWFVLYHPRDIVGGDLYWLREFDDFFLLAVIDCTGHGVPGAFMTMAVNSILNHVVDTICSDDPARILRETDVALRETIQLRKSGDSIVDAGLDIALCRVNPHSRKLTFAGAGLSLHVIADGVPREIRGDRQRVGYSGIHPGFSHTNHVLDIEEGTFYYAATDGFLDEGGGIKGYGFGRERFNEMLVKSAQLPLPQQSKQFERELAQWRGKRTQRDDITMVGFRF